MPRPSWDEYFLTLAVDVSTRSTCLRRSVGAVAVIEKRLLATGYNGAVRNARHCDQTGCLRDQLHVPSGERHELCRATHAEQNCIAQAAMYGTALAGCTIYCTLQPCAICAKLMAQAGVSRIVYLDGYPDELALAFLEEAGVQIEKGEIKSGS